MASKQLNELGHTKTNAEEIAAYNTVFGEGSSGLPKPESVIAKKGGSIRQPVVVVDLCDEEPNVDKVASVADNKGKKESGNEVGVVDFITRLL